MDAVPTIELSKRVNYGWISESFEIFKRDAPIWVVMSLIGFFCSILSDLAFSVVHDSFIISGIKALHEHVALRRIFVESPPSVIAHSFVTLVLAAAFNSCLFFMANNAVRGYKTSVKDVVAHVNLFPAFLVYGTLADIPVLLFDPLMYGHSISLTTTNALNGLSYLYDIVFGAMIWFTYTLLADGKSIADSLRISFITVKQDWVRATVFCIAFSLLTCFSLCACGLGLLVTGPMSYIIASLAYRDTVGMPRDPFQLERIAIDSSWPPPPSG